jgi:hypothetical protein
VFADAAAQTMDGGPQRGRRALPDYTGPQMLEQRIAWQRSVKRNERDDQLEFALAQPAGRAISRNPASKNLNIDRC